MRVISGQKRGQKLVGFSAENVRPTSDRVKEAVFSMVEPYIHDAIVLDLFSGTGALAIEAISRGAQEAICVDISKESIKIINKNIELTHYEKNIKVYTSEALAFLDTQPSFEFDLIFLDPPYSKGIEYTTLEKISSKGLLKQNGIIVLETESDDVPNDINGISVFKQRKYGRTYITIYNRL